MNDRNEFNNSREIDLVDFSANSEMQRIRENERIERERRMRRAAQLRHAEMIRRKKINRIKQMILAWSVLLLAVIAVVALIIGVVSFFKGDKKTENDDNGAAVSSAETELLAEFEAFEGTVFSKGDEGKSQVPEVLETLISNRVKPSVSYLESPVKGSYLSMITDSFIWNASEQEIEKIKQLVRDYPMYSNGYVWTEENSMRSSEVNSYLYDTNAAFVSAVCDICLWDGDTDFLDSTDMTGEANGDISVGMTVGEKLDKVIAHFFDYEDYLNGGGVRYNEEDGLVYVLTADNNGTSSGKPSNIFFNYRFGYVDAYNNMVFNRAMQDLSALYTLKGDKENAEKYAAVAKVNKDAINEKLYNSKLGRYVGCIDKKGDIHDAGFTVINLMAVSLGIADEEKAESILSWVEGEREIASDGMSPNHYVSTVNAPAFSTTTLDDWWFNADGNYSLDDEAKFGDYWINGGPSVLAGNYYLLSAKDKADLLENIAKIYNENEDLFNLPTPTGEAEPHLHYALLTSSKLSEMFSLSTDGKNLCVEPVLDGENVGIKDVAFSGRRYDFLFNENAVYVTCSENAAVRLKIGGFKKNEMLVLTTVEEGIEKSSESVSADKTGTLSISKKFGGNSYIRITEDLQAEKDKDKK